MTAFFRSLCIAPGTGFAAWTVSRHPVGRAEGIRLERTRPYRTERPPCRSWSRVFTSSRRACSTPSGSGSERLAEGQRPLALFVTCSDSRVNPNLITQDRPGRAVHRSQCREHHSAASLGPEREEATIEFALAGLGIKDVIVCGHTRCGAMSGLLNPDGLADMPAVRHWLTHADATRRILREQYGHLARPELMTAAAQVNVLVQLENLRTHPTVAAGLAKGELNLYGWVYKIETGEVFAFDPATGQYAPVAERTPPAILATRLASPMI